MYLPGIPSNISLIYAYTLQTTDHKLELCKLAPDDPDPIRGLIVVSLTSRDGFSVSGGNPLAIVGPSGVTIQGPATETSATNTATAVAVASATATDGDCFTAATPQMSGTTEQRSHNTSGSDMLPAEWEERRTKTGRSYYVNHITKSTQWERPQLLSQQSPAASAAAVQRKHSEPRIHGTMNNLSSPASGSAGIGSSSSMMSFAANIAEDAAASAVPTGSASSKSGDSSSANQQLSDGQSNCTSTQIANAQSAANPLDISGNANGDAAAPNISDGTASQPAVQPAAATRRKLQSRQSHDDLAQHNGNSITNDISAVAASFDASATSLCISIGSTAEQQTPGREDMPSIIATVVHSPDASTVVSAASTPNGHESTAAEGRPNDQMAQRIRKSTRNDDAARRRNSRNIRPAASSTHSPAAQNSTGSGSVTHQHRAENGGGAMSSSRTAMELPNGYGERIGSKLARCFCSKAVVCGRIL